MSGRPSPTALGRCFVLLPVKLDEHSPDIELVRIPDHLHCSKGVVVESPGTGKTL